LPPVTPLPPPFSQQNQTIFILLPERNVLLYSWIEIHKDLLIACMHIIHPNPIITNTRKRLIREFFIPVASRNRRKQYAVCFLPTNQLIQPLFCQRVRR